MIRVNGKELWRMTWKTQGDDGINVAQPVVVGKDQVFIASAYGRGRAASHQQRRESAVVRRDGLGHRTRRHALQVQQPGHAHVGSCTGWMMGISSASMSQTGKVHMDRWPISHEKQPAPYSHGQILLCDDLLVVLTEYGEVVIVEPTPEKFHELGRWRFLKGNKTWNNPAISDGILYIRNHVEMAAIDLRANL